MAQFDGGLEFSSARPVRVDPPPATLPVGPLRLSFNRLPTIALGDFVGPGTLLAPPEGSDPVGVVSPIAGRVGAIIPWRDAGRRDEAGRFDLILEPDASQAPTALERTPPRSRDELGGWIQALAAVGPWTEYGLGVPGDLVEQLVEVRRCGPPVMVIGVGLDNLSAYPDRMSLLCSFPDDAVLGLKVLAELVGARRAKLVVAQTMPGLRRLRCRCKDFGVRLIGVPNVYPSADPTVVVAHHAPRRLASRGLPHRASPVSLGVLLTTPWTLIRLARWITRGQVDLVRPMFVGWSTTNQPLEARWVFPGQPLASLAPALAGKTADLFGRVVVGHPMTGRAFTSAVTRDGPLPPTVPEDEQLACLVTQPLPAKPEPCIACGWCVEVCPTRLRPIRLAELAERGVEDRRLTGPLQWCIQCNLCTHVCPTHLPLARVLGEAQDRYL